MKRDIYGAMDQFPPLELATKPCESCVRAAGDRESALALCNSRRIAAYEREKAMQEAFRACQRRD